MLQKSSKIGKTTEKGMGTGGPHHQKVLSKCCSEDGIGNGHPWNKSKNSEAEIDDSQGAAHMIIGGIARNRTGILTHEPRTPFTYRIIVALWGCITETRLSKTFLKNAIADSVPFKKKGWGTRDCMLIRSSHQ